MKIESKKDFKKWLLIMFITLAVLAGLVYGFYVTYWYGFNDGYDDAKQFYLKYGKYLLK